jgi:LPPG:FO 2-phospho-L-lactate transferase
MPKITCLAGGVGAARFLQGLVKVIPPKNVSVIINTGDDIELYGLHISPDIDIVTYTLAGIVDEGRGWGIRNDTFNCLENLRRLGFETWFNLGDRDLATHLSRTNKMKAGIRLSQITEIHARQLGVEASLIPMTDDLFTTNIKTKQETIHFQEYLVHRGASDAVSGVEFIGAEESKPSPGVIEVINEADGIVICPSNPIVSIGTILNVPGIRETLRMTRAKITAISPIIGGSTVKGPADKIMAGLGLEVSCYSVAKLYSDFIDSFVIDQVDSHQKDGICRLGANVLVTNTIMKTLDDKVSLAETTLKSIQLV